MIHRKLLLAAALLGSVLGASRPGLAQNDAQFVSQSVPAALLTGETRAVTVTLRNTGTTLWTRFNDEGYKLGTQNPQDNTLWTGGPRIYLPAGAQINPGQSWTFSFNITAPSTPGTYNFQWRMVQEFVGWFGDFTPNVAIRVSIPVAVCPGVPMPAPGSDAGPALRQCIANTPSGGTLEIPPGTYTINSTVRINKPMTLRTAGTAGSTQSCEVLGSACAVLQAHVDSLLDGGFLVVESTTGVTLDHLILDGDRDHRLGSIAAAHCRNKYNRYGFNARMTNCSSCRFTYNVSRNALCGTALEYAGHDATIVRNAFKSNGQDHRTANDLWADGLTVSFSDRATITDNSLIDNTGVALIVGGAKDAKILRNLIRQPTRVSFAGLMLFNFQNRNNSGDFSGTLVSQNDINCGSLRNCHFGLMLGPHPWNPSLWITGGTVTGNTVVNARQGINVEGTNLLTLYGNSTTGSPASATFLCGTRATSNLNIYDAFVDRHGDTTPATARLWHDCP